jgi:hypothetical protein
MFGVPCFRPASLPVFVIVTDAPLHNGPVAAHAYDPVVAADEDVRRDINALDAIHARVVGVPVAGGNPGAARADLSDLAKKTGSLYHDPAFGGSDKPWSPTPTWPRARSRRRWCGCSACSRARGSTT